MNFEPSQRAKDFQQRLMAFMDERVYPAEEVYAEALAEAGSRHAHPPVMEELKAEARRRRLWNLFLPDAERGARLTNLEYAPLAEIMGRVPWASEVFNCNAPDTGNMELLHLFADAKQREEWLLPLFEGRIRSAFAMTEPDVASSDATNVKTTIARQGDSWASTGASGMTTNAAHPDCRLLDRDGKDGPERRTAPPTAAWSSVPLDAPGVSVIRTSDVFATIDRRRDTARS